jgi:hypothetical protein
MNLKNLLVKAGFIVLLILGTLSSNALANTIYVNNQTGSNSNSGTVTSPKFDLDGVNGAISAALDGDVIVVNFTGINYAQATLTKTLTLSSLGGTPQITSIIINNSSGITLSGPFKTSGLTMTNGVLNGSGNLTINSGGTITISNSSNSYLDVAPVFAGTVNLIYNTANATTRSEFPTGTAALNNLTVSGAITVTVNTSAQVNGLLLIDNASGILALGANTLTLSNTSTGNINYDVRGSITASSGGIVLNASGTGSNSSFINGANTPAGTLPGVTINAAGETITFGNNTGGGDANGPTVIKGDLIVNGGTVNVFSIDGNSSTTGITGSVSNNGIGTVTIDPQNTGNASTLRIGGNLMNTPSATVGSGSAVGAILLGNDAFNILGNVANSASLNNTTNSKVAHAGNIEFGTGNIHISGSVTLGTTFAGAIGSNGGGNGGFATEGNIVFGATANSVTIDGLTQNNSSSSYNGGNSNAGDFSDVGSIDLAMTGGTAIFGGGLANNSAGFANNLGGGGVTAPTIGDGRIAFTGAFAGVFNVGTGSASANLVNSSTSAGNNGNIDLGAGSATVTVFGNVTLSGSASNGINFSTGATRVTGTVTNSRSNNNAALTFGATTATVRVGGVAQSGSGSIVFSNTAASGTITIDNDLNISNGKVTAVAKTGATPTSIGGNFVMSGGAFEDVSTAAGANITVAGNMTLTGGRLNLGTTVAAVAKTLTVSGTNNEIDGTVVNANSSGTASNGAVTLVITKTIAAQTLTVTANSFWPGNLSITNTFPVGPVFTLQGNNLTVGGNVTFAAAGGISPLVDLGNNNLIMTGTSALFTNNNGYTAQAGAVVMRGATQSVVTNVGGGSNSAIYNLEVDNGGSTVTIGTAADGGNFTYVFNGFLRLTSGTVQPFATDVISFNNTAGGLIPTIYRGQGLLSVTPTFTSSVDVTYTSTTTLTTSGELPTAASKLRNLTVQSAGGNQIVTVRNYTVTAISAANPAVVTIGAHTLSVGDVVRLAGSSGGINGQYTIGAVGANTITLTGANGVGAAQAGNIYVDPVVNGTLTTISGQTLALAGNILTEKGSAIVNNGSITALAGGVIILNNTNGTAVTGSSALPDITVADGSSGNTIFGPSGITSGVTNNLTFAGSGSLAISFTGSGTQIGGNLTTAANATLTLNSSVTVGKNLVHANGTIDLHGFNLSVGTGQTASTHSIGTNATFAGTGTLIFKNSASGNSSISAGLNANINIPVQVNFSASTDQLQVITNALTFSNNVTLTQGVLFMNGVNVNLTGNALNLTSNSAVSAAGAEVIRFNPASGVLAVSLAGATSLPATRISGNTTLSGSSGDLTVASLVHDGGTLNFADRNIIVSGAYTRTGGSYSATTGILILKGAIAQGSGFSIPNLEILEGGPVGIADNQMLVTKQFILDMTANSQLTTQPGTTPRLAIADSAQFVYMNGTLDQSPVYQGTITLVASNTANNSKIPSNIFTSGVTVTTFRVDAGGNAIQIPGSRNVTSVLDLRNGLLDVQTSAANLTITGTNSTLRVRDHYVAGHVINQGNNGTVTFSNPPAVIYEPDNNTAIVTAEELPGTIASLLVTRSANKVNSLLTINSNVTINGALDIRNNIATAAGVSLNVAGNVSVSSEAATYSNAGTPTVAFDASSPLVFTGTTQTFTTPGITVSNIQLNQTGTNPMVTVSGGNLTVTGAVTFTNGLLVMSGSNVLILTPAAGAQGYVHTTTNLSHVVGNIQKHLATSAVGRFEFPVGTLTAYRPVAFTFGSPTSSAVITATDLKVSADSVNPGGTNGLPLTISGQLVDTTANFSWTITSSVSLGPSQTFDVEFQGTGFTNYTNVANIRAIAKLGAVKENPWIPQTGIYSNFEAVPGLPIVRVTGSTGNLISQGAKFTFGFAKTINLATVSGNVLYGNGASGVKSVVVTLNPGGLTSTTTSTGAFSFANVVAGTYTLSASTANSWLGANATDALLVSGYFNGTATFSAIQKLAADVNASGSINNTDALLIVRRFAGLDGSFAAGNWAFTSPTVVVAGTSIAQNIQALVTGDVNGSDSTSLAGIPKTEQSVNLISDGSAKTSINQAFSVPVKVGSAMKLGAVSLRLTYPSDLVTFVGVSGSKFVANDNKGTITLAWADMTGGKETLNLKAEDVLVALNFKPTENFKAGSQFSVSLDGSASELAQVDGTVLHNAVIKVASLEAAVPTSFSLRQNYPNPFNPSTTIEYDLPANGSVKLAIYNILGQEVASLVNQVQNAGSYKAVWNASNVASGVYFYRLTVDAGSQKFTQIHRMMLLK